MNKCVIHNEEITHFCQKCCDIICDQCLKSSHSDKLHQIEALEKAYSTRVTSVQAYLDSDVKTKRNALLQQIAKISQKIEEISKTSKVIKNDVLVEVQGLTIRLNNAEAEKVVKFHSEIKRLEHLVNIIDDVFYAFEESVKVPQKFLLLYKQFKERMLSVDVYKIEDALSGDHIELPEEFKQTQRLVQKSAEMEKESRFINEVLVTVLKSYQSTLKLKQLSIRERHSKIIQEYFNLNEKLITHSFSLSKSCYFCGSFLSLSTINTPCSYNRPYKIGDTKSSTFLEAPVQIRGTKRHHWMSTKKQLSENRHIQNNKLHLILITMRKSLYQKSTSVNDLFKQQDPKSAGVVSKLVFSYILTNRLGMQQEEIDVLISNFGDINGNVSYQKLNGLIKDKEYLEQPVSATSGSMKASEVVVQKKRYAY